MVSNCSLFSLRIHQFSFDLTAIMLDATDVQVSFKFSLHFAQVSSGKGCLENPLQRKAVAVPGSTDANLELTLAEMGMSSPLCAFLPLSLLPNDLHYSKPIKIILRIRHGALKAVPAVDGRAHTVAMLHRQISKRIKMLR